MNHVAPGCYGKLPGTGDFFVRRLPDAFVSAWDSWQQRVLSASREQLRERWKESYLTAPIWRFALAPGACASEGYAGILMSSVDRVGRAFPLTIAIALATTEHVAHALLGGSAWFVQLEHIALRALQDNANAEALDRELLCMPTLIGEPPALPQAGSGPDHAQSVMRLGRLDDFEQGLAIAGLVALTPSRWRSLWWTRGREGNHPAALLCPDLPGCDEFCAMLTV